MGGIINLKQCTEEVLNDVRKILDGYGIFCASSKNNSITMWSHYADHHRGVVLGFTPKQKESFLLASHAIIYSDKRPIAFTDTKEFIKEGLFGDIQAFSEKALRTQILTKSKEWQYEEEYRIAIAGTIPEGSDWSTIKFNRNELSEIYLGTVQK